MGTMIIVKVLPFSQLLIEKLRVVYNYALEHLIELFFVDSVASLYFPIQPGPSRLDIYMINALVQHMPVELSLKLRAIVRWEGMKKSHDRIADPIE
jgi:hypothetical protein